MKVVVESDTRLADGTIATGIDPSRVLASRTGLAALRLALLPNSHDAPPILPSSCRRVRARPSTLRGES